MVENESKYIYENHDYFTYDSDAGNIYIYYNKLCTIIIMLLSVVGRCEVLLVTSFLFLTFLSSANIYSNVY